MPDGSFVFGSTWPELTALFVCRKKTERSKKFFTDLMAKEHVPTMINPKPCGHLCCCAIAGCEEVKLTRHSRGSGSGKEANACALGNANFS